MIRVCLLSVCHNSYDEAVAFINSLNESVNPDKTHLDCYVIDNSTEVNHSAIKLLQEIEVGFSLRHIKSPNLGYFPSASAAISKFNIPIDSYDYTIISNVDLAISADFFSQLEKVDLSASVGSIAPSIYSKALKVNRNPKIRSKPSLKKLRILKFLFSTALTYAFLRFANHTRLRLRELNGFRHYRSDEVHEKPITRIYAGHGSFIILTQLFCAELKEIDYPVFLFGEEIYVGEMCLKLSLDVVFCPDLVVYDTEHVSTGEMKPSSYRKLNADALGYLLQTYDF